MSNETSNKNMTPTSLHGAGCPECRTGILHSLPHSGGLRCDNCGRWWAPHHKPVTMRVRRP